jgi:nicotinate-nucleotide adenylyltransferase
MGSDSYQNLPEWKNYRQLLRQYEIFVYQRPNFEAHNTYENSSVTFLKAPLLEISSTYIRKIIKEGKSIRYLVPEKVRLEIEQNGYYRNSL